MRARQLAAGPRFHRDAAEWRHAHRGVDAASLTRGAQAAATTKVSQLDATMRKFGRDPAQRAHRRLECQPV